MSTAATLRCCSSNHRIVHPTFRRARCDSPFRKRRTRRTRRYSLITRPRQPSYSTGTKSPGPSRWSGWRGKRSGRPVRHSFERILRRSTVCNDPFRLLDGDLTPNLCADYHDVVALQSAIVGSAVFVANTDEQSALRNFRSDTKSALAALSSEMRQVRDFAIEYLTKHRVEYELHLDTKARSKHEQIKETPPVHGEELYESLSDRLDVEFPGGFTADATQMYIKRVFAYTDFHTEIGFSSALNLMRADSLGTYFLHRCPACLYPNSFLSVCVCVRTYRRGILDRLQVVGRRAIMRNQRSDGNYGTIAPRTHTRERAFFSLYFRVRRTVASDSAAHSANSTKREFRSRSLCKRRVRRCTLRRRRMVPATPCCRSVRT
jgi:hypothetical protein